MMTMGREASFDKQKNIVWKPEDILADESAVKEIIVPYGNSQDQLVPGLHYPSPIAGGQLFSGTVTYTTTGVKTISGAGFLPKLIKITASISGTDSGWSDGVYFGGSENCRYIYSTGGAIAVGRIGYSAYCQTQFSGGNASITTTIVPTSDGFTINVANIGGGTINIGYECYG